MEKEDRQILYRALLCLRTPEEASALLDDLCTAAEREEMSRRLRAALLLRAGSPYNDVVALTGLSTATISRVSRSLKNGEGYACILPRMEEAEAEEKA